MRALKSELREQGHLNREMYPTCGRALNVDSLQEGSLIMVVMISGAKTISPCKKYRGVCHSTALCDHAGKWECETVLLGELRCRQMQAVIGMYTPVSISDACKHCTVAEMMLPSVGLRQHLNAKAIIRDRHKANERERCKPNYGSMFSCGALHAGASSNGGCKRQYSGLPPVGKGTIDRSFSLHA
jgi:hypothetical protein